MKIDPRSHWVVVVTILSGWGLSVAGCNPFGTDPSSLSYQNASMDGTSNTDLADGQKDGTSDLEASVDGRGDADGGSGGIDVWGVCGDKDEKMCDSGTRCVRIEEIDVKICVPVESTCGDGNECKGDDELCLSGQCVDLVKFEDRFCDGVDDMDSESNFNDETLSCYEVDKCKRICNESSSYDKYIARKLCYEDIYIEGDKCRNCGNRNISPVDSDGTLRCQKSGCENIKDICDKDAESSNSKCSLAFKAFEACKKRKDMVECLWRDLCKKYPDSLKAVLKVEACRFEDGECRESYNNCFGCSIEEYDP